MKYTISLLKECIKKIDKISIYNMDTEQFLKNKEFVTMLDILLEVGKINRRKIWGIDVSMRARGLDSHPYHDREELYNKSNVELFLIFQISEYLQYEEHANSIGASYLTGSLYRIIRRMSKPWLIRNEPVVIGKIEFREMVKRLDHD